MLKLANSAISIFKYILAVYMMLAGISTCFGDLNMANVHHFQFIINTRVSLVIFGVWFFISGATLLYGKIRQNRGFIGRGIMLIYLCFFFVTLLDILMTGFFPLSNWIPNGIGTLICALLFLRWKIQNYYILHPRTHHPSH